MDEPIIGPSIRPTPLMDSSMEITVSTSLEYINDASEYVLVFKMADAKPK